MKRIFTIIASAIMLAVVSVSCSDINRIQQDIDELKDRVSQLEALLPVLNRNIDAVKKLTEVKSIKEVTLNKEDNTYSIILNDNTVIKLTQGSIGVGNIPVMSVDKDGYWVVDYQDGKGFVQVLRDGEPVFASGQNGVTPKFSIIDGFWNVSYNDGKDFTQVLDAEGKPVKAVSEGGSVASDPFFKDIKVTGETLSVILANGKAIELPIVSDFLCQIKGADKPVEFAPNQTKIFDVELQGVVSTIVTAPQDWTANLQANKLTVIAPSINVPETKAVIADSRTDVSILAISASGLSVISKLVVSLNGEISPDPTPGPDVPPLSNDLYTEYQTNGREITIAGKTYSKAVNGDAVLITAESAHQELKPEIAGKSAFIFLETPEGTSFTIGSYTNIDGDVVLCSRYSDNKAVFAPKFAFKLLKGTLTLENLRIDQSSFDKACNYFIYNADPKVGNFFDGLYFENCDFLNIVKPVVNLSYAKSGIKEMIIRNNVFQIIPEAKQKFQLLNIYKSEVLDTFKKFVFDNNLLYCTKGVKWLQILSYDNSVAQKGTVWDLQASLSNNTIYNLVGGNVFFKFYEIKSFRANKNLFYADPTFAECGSAIAIVFSPNQQVSGLDLTDNIAYGLAEGKSWLLVHGNSSVKVDKNIIEKQEETPFESADPSTGKFVPKAQFATYGVQRSK